jgi:hypothetical protein
MDQKTGGMIGAGCGALLLFASFAMAMFFAFHVFVDPRGAISADEAAPGMLAGCCCSMMSLLILGAGVFAAVRAGKRAGQG